MLSSASFPVLVVDDKGRIVMLNKACESLSGYSSDEARGRPFPELLMGPEGAAAWAGCFDPLRPDRIPARTEAVWRTRRGELRWVASCNSVIAFESEAPNHVVSIGMDVTETRRMEHALLQKSDHERRRLGQDLHDGLGQDLTGIALSARLLRTQLSGQGNAGAEIAKRIEDLASRAISSSRTLARDRLLPLEDQDLRSHIDRLALRIQQTFDVKCEASWEEGFDLRDEDAAVQLYWIVQEAVTNAVRHAQARSIRILGRRDKRKLRVAVQDDGQGLGPAKGTGAGVEIMRSRARSIGADFRIRNAPEGGVLVECVLPIKGRKSKG